VFPINKFKKIAILSVSLLILLGGLFFFILSLESVQTQFAQQITQNVNSRFDTDISIQRASINLKGEVLIRDILIQDHHQDSLLFVRELKTSLNGLDRFLNRNYDFKSIGLDGVQFFLTQYPNETQSSLQYFVEKLKDSSGTKPKAFSFKSEILDLNNAEVVIEDRNVLNSKNSFWDIDLALEAFNFEKDVLSVDIQSLNGSSDLYGTIHSFQADIQYSPESLISKSFALKLNKNEINGSGLITFLGGNLANLSPAEFSIQLDKNTIQLNDFSFLKPYLKAQSMLEADAVVEGNLQEFELNFKLKGAFRSLVEGTIQVVDGFQKNKMKISSKALKIKTSNKALDDLLLKETYDQLKPFTAKTRDLIIDSEFSGGQNNWSISTDVKTSLGTLSPNLELKRTDITQPWEYSVALDVDNFDLGTLFNQKKPIKGTASVSINATVDGSKPTRLDFKGLINQLEIGENTFDNLSFFAKHKNNLTTASLSSAERRHLFDMEIRFNHADESLEVEGDLKSINLSSFALADVNSDIALSSSLSLKKNKNTAVKNQFNVQLGAPIIRSNGKQIQFKDLNLSAQSVGTEKSIAIQDSDAINLLIEGDFRYNKFESLISGMIADFLFVKATKLISPKQFFGFDVQMKSKLTEALFPNVSTPDDFFLSGTISSNVKETSVVFDIPILLFKKYKFKGLHFETDSNNQIYTSFMSADQIRIGALETNDLFLISSPNNNKNQIRLEGTLGTIESNTFEANLSYTQDNTSTAIDINEFTLKNDSIVWELERIKGNQIVYDSKTQAYKVNPIAIANSEQRIQLAGKYRSKNEFDIQLDLKDVAIEPFLPPSDNYKIQSDLNSNISFYKTPVRNDASLDITLSDLIVNEVEMGDLMINSSGNTVLNSYKNELTLVKDNTKKLAVTGGILVHNKRTSLDLDVEMNSLDMSFLSRLGKGKITEIRSFLTGEFNLWGPLDDLTHIGNLTLDGFNLRIPFTNAAYGLEESTKLILSEQKIKFVSTSFFDQTRETEGQLKGTISHLNFKNWSLDMDINSDRLLLMNRKKEKGSLFYGSGYFEGDIHIHGPTKNLMIDVDGATAEGTSILIPWEENTGLADVSFIDFVPKADLYKPNTEVEEEFQEITISRGLEMTFDLDVNNKAAVEIVVDQVSGSTLTGRGSGNLLMETNTDGKFNMWGDFVAYDGVYNFKNFGLIDKKFNVNPGGTIVWEGDPLEAQMNIEAVYEVPGGANPALLVDNPNFNKKIPTNVLIKLEGSLLKPDNPGFEINFPNTSGIVTSEINYRLADQQRMQLQAISLLSQGLFVSDVSFSTQGIANNLYEKASDILSSLIGEGDGKLNFGLNYLKGDERPDLDIRSQDRIGVTFVTQISDKILLNGKIGVPVGGVEETLIVGDVQIDFILNEEGTLKAKVFNKENEFRYISDDLGYTQGVGLSYQVDFKTFEGLVQKIISKNNKKTTETKSE
jgi:hypothetical protein